MWLSCLFARSAIRKKMYCHISDSFCCCFSFLCLLCLWLSVLFMILRNIVRSVEEEIFRRSHTVCISFAAVASCFQLLLFLACCFVCCSCFFCLFCFSLLLHYSLSSPIPSFFSQLPSHRQCFLLDFFFFCILLHISFCLFLFLTISSCFFLLSSSLPLFFLFLLFCICN